MPSIVVAAVAIAADAANQVTPTGTKAVIEGVHGGATDRQFKRNVVSFI
ncbi:hypothetical protein [uncultured Planococcus sp.]|nr:hypothetical protein [uncultured Planococcus sp.]